MLDKQKSIPDININNNEKLFQEDENIKKEDMSDIYKNTEKQVFGNLKIIQK